MRLKELAARYGLPVWMTEYWSPSYGSWTGALSWAKTMHELITVGGVSAIDYLWAFFGDWVPPGGSMVSITFDHGVYQRFSYTPLYWATGQFSRFVRPGYVRVSATPAAGTALVSAYKGRGRLVLVAINPNAQATPVRFVVAGGHLGARVSTVRSSDKEQWAVLPPARSSGSTFSATLAPGSLTTFIARVVQ